MSTTPRPYSNLSFQTLYDFPKVGSLGDMLILNDNFDRPIHRDASLNLQLRGQSNKLVSTIIIMVCLDGHIDLTNNMKQFRLERNDAIINLSGTLGGFYGMSDDARFMLAIVSSNFYFPNIVSGDPSEVQLIMRTNPVCHLSDDDAETTLTIYNTLKKLLNAVPQPLYIRELAQGLVHAYAFSILSPLVMESRERTRQHTKVSRSQDIYNRFLEEVEKYHAEERDIKFYADKLCLTPKYLSQIIYKECGSYAGEIIRTYVILEAKALIKSRRYTFSQICDLLHFNSQSFFTKYFKNATGLSPTEYQNQ